MELENKNLKNADKQAIEQLLSVMFSCRQLKAASKNSQEDSKICVIYGNSKNFSWFGAKDELESALKSLYESNGKDCRISIAEFRGEKFGQNYVASIKAFYLKLPKTKKFNPSTTNDGVKMILDYCKVYKLPIPSIILYDGNEYCLAWILKESMNGCSSVGLWKKIQTFLAERFFYFLDEGLYVHDGESLTDRFVEAHCQVTAMLRVPGFLNTQTKGVDLFNAEQKVQIVFNSEKRYDTGEIVFKLRLPKYKILEYRKAKESANGYLPKKSTSRKKKTQTVQAEVKKPDGTLYEGMKADLTAYHNPRDIDTYVYVQRKNIEKKAKTDRQFFYDSYSVANIEKFVHRKDISICDFWATAAEYTFGFSKIKERKILRTRENGEQHEEIRRGLTKREKWIEAIQLNFLHLNFRKSELGYIPTLEQARELIFARCEKFNLPKPVIVDTGDNGENLELRWLWKNAMKNCGDRDKNVLYPKFNRKFDNMQDELFRLFWDFGVDEKKLSVTSMLRVVGTPNTKTGKITNVFSDADEILTYEEFAQRLGANFGRAVKKEASDNAVIEKVDAPVKTVQIPKLNDDLSRLHSGSNYWACLCTENKLKGERGEWTEYWTTADKLHEKLAELRSSIPDFNEFNVYVSQLEFSERCRKVENAENVAAFRACFVDIDGKITGENLTADGWKDLILKFCVDKKIPIPSEMVFSGNGVHVKFFFDKLMTVNEFPRWERLEIKLTEIFEEIGADSHSKDGARVLRVEGTKNCKPETKDRNVRVIFTGEDYDFEKFAQIIENLPSSSEEIKIPEPVLPKKIAVAKSPSKHVSKTAKSAEISKRSRTMTDKEAYDKTWFYLSDLTAGTDEWISKSDFVSYSKKLNRKHRVECSIVEFKSKNRHDRRQAIENFYFSYVTLSRCPGENLEEKIRKIKEHCRNYRDTGIPEPNRIMEDGNNLILLWRYSKERTGQELRGVALPRWKAVQEYLSRHFENWGALDNPECLKATALLPLPGFSSVKFVYENPALKYIFDDVAKPVLPFSQEAVAIYMDEKKKKPCRHAIVLEDLTKIYVERREADGRKSKFNPALKIFNDIVRLLRIRSENSLNGEVPEGRRELCVFAALDYAVPAGLVKNDGAEDFNGLARKLIDFCGESFKSDCTPDTMMTLRGKFLNCKPVYSYKKKTLIRILEITPEEQSELDILTAEVSAKPKRKKKHKWEILGKSKATYYRHEKKYEKSAAKLRELRAVYYSCLWFEDKLVRILNKMKMRQKMHAYYEGERGALCGACQGKGGLDESSFYSRGKFLGEEKERVGRVGVIGDSCRSSGSSELVGDFFEVGNYLMWKLALSCCELELLGMRDWRRCCKRRNELRRLMAVLMRGSVEFENSG